MNVLGLLCGISLYRVENSNVETEIAFLLGQNILTPEQYWVSKLKCSIWLSINFNAALTSFESDFTEHLGGAAIKNIAVVGFLCSLGVQYVLVNFFVYVNDFKNKFVMEK